MTERDLASIGPASHRKLHIIIQLRDLYVVSRGFILIDNNNYYNYYYYYYYYIYLGQARCCFGRECLFVSKITGRQLQTLSGNRPATADRSSQFGPIYVGPKIIIMSVR